MKYAVHLDNDPNVLSYSYETLKISYVSNVKTGKLRNYKPDFIVERQGLITIVEIKPTRFLTKRAIIKKLMAGREYAAAHGMAYEVLTEHELRGLGLL